MNKRGAFLIGLELLEVGFLVRLDIGFSEGF